MIVVESEPYGPIKCAKKNNQIKDNNARLCVFANETLSIDMIHSIPKDTYLVERMAYEVVDDDAIAVVVAADDDDVVVAADIAAGMVAVDMSVLIVLVLASSSLDIQNK